MTDSSSTHKVHFRDTGWLDGYNTFDRCTVTSDGRKVSFCFPNGVSYEDVPLSFICSWYSGATSTRRGKQWVACSFSEEIPLDCTEETMIVNHRRCPLLKDDPLMRLLLLYLSNGKGIAVTWHHVLASCEPRFELFNLIGCDSLSELSKLARPRLRLSNKILIMPYWSIKDYDILDRGRSLSIEFRCGDAFVIGELDLVALIESQPEKAPLTAPPIIKSVRRTAANPNALWVRLENGYRWQLYSEDVLRQCDYRYSAKA
jgi:hypothetical protein